MKFFTFAKVFTSYRQPRAAGVSRRARIVIDNLVRYF